MKCFLAFALFGSTTAQNSTQKLRSLLSTRDGVTLTDAPKVEGAYCGHHRGENINCRVDFKDGKMRIAYKRDGFIWDGCSRCGKSVGFDCKDISYKVTNGSAVTSGLGSDGYDVHFESSCIQEAMGLDDKNPNKVPLRLNIHDLDSHQEVHMDLIECYHQDDGICDDDLRCYLTHNGLDGSGCDDWDVDPDPCPHPESRRRRGDVPVPIDGRRRSSASSRAKDCRRRAGSSSRGLPVPEDEHDDDLLDLDDIEVV